MQLICHVTTIVSGVVAITAHVLLLWPLLAGISAAVCGAAVIGGELARHLANAEFDRMCREQMAGYRREVWARRDREVGL